MTGRARGAARQWDGMGPADVLPRTRSGSLGVAGRPLLISSAVRVAGCWALVSDPERPCQPCSRSATRSLPRMPSGGPTGPPKQSALRAGGNSWPGPRLRLEWALRSLSVPGQGTLYTSILFQSHSVYVCSKSLWPSVGRLFHFKPCDVSGRKAGPESNGPALSHAPTESRPTGKSQPDPPSWHQPPPPPRSSSGQPRRRFPGCRIPMAPLT